MPRRLIIVLSLLATVPAPAIAQYAPSGGFAVRMLAHQALVRSELAGLLPPERRVSQWGAELILPTPLRWMRVEARLLRSERGSADLHSVDAGLVAGWPAIAVAAAYGKRGSYDPSSGLAHARDVEFGRLGLRLQAASREAPLLIHLRGDAYLPTQRATSPADELSGWDAEGGVTWRTRSLPFSASVGYRLERFRIFSVEQEVSALTFALGLMFGGR